MSLRPSQVDARGNFLMEGIPPGNYEVSLQFFGAGAPQQPRWAKREVSVQNGVVTDVMLTVDLTNATEAVNGEQKDATVYCSNCAVRSGAWARATVGAKEYR